MSKLPKSVIDILKEKAGDDFSRMIVSVYNIGKEEGFNEAIDTLKCSARRRYTEESEQEEESYELNDPVYEIKGLPTKMQGRGRKNS